MTRLTTILTKQLEDYPERPLIKEVGQKDWLTGWQFSADVQRIKDGFERLKIGYGDLLLVCLDNSAVYPELMQAIWTNGAIAHPVSETTPIEEIRAELERHQYAGMIVKQSLADQLTLFVKSNQVQLPLASSAECCLLGNPTLLNTRKKAPQQLIAEEDLALILNTSGTTGIPKRVGLTHRLLVNGALHDAKSHDLSPQDTTLITMPMFHINAQVMSVLSTRVSGGRILVAPKFSATKFWQQVAEDGVTWASIVPTIVTILLLNEQAKEQYVRFRQELHLRFLRSSSFSLPEDKLTAFESRFGVRILEGYGMTETASQCTINPFDAPKIGSAGKPYATELQILTPEGFTQAAYVTGEIAVAGDHVIHDYLDHNPDSFKDGWFLTGDLGYLDEDGYLFVKGRSKEMISRGGEKVAPAFVESVLNELPFIAHVAVIGIPDPIYGEAVTAVVISRTPHRNEAQQRQAISEYSAQKLARHERPTKIYFVEEYPRNATGKVLRAQLKELVLQLPLAVAVNE